MTYFSAPGIISERDPYRAVYNLLKVTKEQLISNSRKREIVTGRYLIMNMLKQTTNRSLDSIGSEFKKRSFKRYSWYKDLQ